MNHQPSPPNEFTTNFNPAISLMASNNISYQLPNGQYPSCTGYSYAYVSHISPGFPSVFPYSPQRQYLQALPGIFDNVNVPGNHSLQVTNPMPTAPIPVSNNNNNTNNKQPKESNVEKPILEPPCSEKVITPTPEPQQPQPPKPEFSLKVESSSTVTSAMISKDHILKKHILNNDIRKDGWHLLLGDNDMKKVENILKTAIEADTHFANFNQEFVKMCQSTATIGDESLAVSAMWNHWRENVLYRQKQIHELKEEKLNKLYVQVCRDNPDFLNGHQAVIPDKIALNIKPVNVQSEMKSTSSIIAKQSTEPVITKKSIGSIIEHIIENDVQQPLKKSSRTPPVKEIPSVNKTDLKPRTLIEKMPSNVPSVVESPPNQSITTKASSKLDKFKPIGSEKPQDIQQPAKNPPVKGIPSFDTKASSKLDKFKPISSENPHEIIYNDPTYTKCYNEFAFLRGEMDFLDSQMIKALPPRNYRREQTKLNLEEDPPKVSLSETVNRSQAANKSSIPSSTDQERIGFNSLNSSRKPSPKITPENKSPDIHKPRQNEPNVSDKSSTDQKDIEKPKVITNTADNYKRTVIPFDPPSESIQEKRQNAYKKPDLHNQTIQIHVTKHGRRVKDSTDGISDLKSSMVSVNPSSLTSSATPAASSTFIPDKPEPSSNRSNNIQVPIIRKDYSATKKKKFNNKDLIPITQSQTILPANPSPLPSFGQSSYYDGSQVMDYAKDASSNTMNMMTKPQSITSRDINLFIEREIRSLVDHPPPSSSPTSSKSHNTALSGVIASPPYTNPKFFTVPRKYTDEQIYINDLLDYPARSHRPHRIVFIIRGLPGSGKSYLTRLIKEKEEKFNPFIKSRSLSLDDYFMVQRSHSHNSSFSMVYEYDPTKEDEYKYCLLKEFRRIASQKYFNFIIVDSVNSTINEVRDYYACAIENEYIPYVIEMEVIIRRLLDDCLNGEEIVAHCYKHNRHGRSVAEIRNLYQQWELLPDSYLRVDAYSLIMEHNESIRAPEIPTCKTMEPSKPQWSNQVNPNSDNNQKMDEEIGSLRTRTRSYYEDNEIEESLSYTKRACYNDSWPEVASISAHPPNNINNNSSDIESNNASKHLFSSTYYGDPRLNY